MPNWQAPIPERLVTRNLSKIPIKPRHPDGLASRGVAARLSLVSGWFQGVAVSDDTPHDTRRPPGVKFRGGKIGKRLFRPPRVTGGAGKGGAKLAVCRRFARPKSLQSRGNGPDLPVQQDHGRTVVRSQGRFPFFPQITCPMATPNVLIL